MDVRTFRGANTVSEHFLVVSKLCARISNCKQEHDTTVKKYNTYILKTSDIPTLYKQNLSNEKRKMEKWSEKSINERLHAYKTATTNAAEGTFGDMEKGEVKDWIDDE
jgi:hypothetical protein